MRGIQINRGKQLKLTIGKSRLEPLAGRDGTAEDRKIVHFSSTQDHNALEDGSSEANGNNRAKTTQLSSSEQAERQKRGKMRTVCADSPSQGSTSEVAQSRTSFVSRISLSGSKTHSELKIKSTASIGEEREFSKEVRTILQQLSHHKLFSENYRGICTLRRQTLSQLLDYLFSALSQSKPAALDSIHSQHLPLKCLHPVINLLFEKISAKKREGFAHRASLLSNCNISAYSRAAYQLETACGGNRLGQMLEQQQDARTELAKLQAEREFTGREVDGNRKNILGQLRQKMQLQDSVRELCERQRKLRLELQSLKIQISAIEEETHKITNYIDLQSSNQILKMVSSDYKRIEEDIYEYAVYLQSNQLASSLDFEPLPFQAMQDIVEQELKQLQQMVARQDVSLKGRAEAMRQFLGRTMEYFRKKDAEVSKLGEFKTRCIRKFVSNMQRWLDNWSLKQEYLVNLRKEFAAHCLRHGELMRQAREQGYCECCQKAVLQVVEEVERIHLKMEENYKLGNSFY